MIHVPAEAARSTRSAAARVRKEYFVTQSGQFELNYWVKLLSQIEKSSLLFQMPGIEYEYSKYDKYCQSELL